MFDPSVRAGARMRLRLIVAGVALESAWGVLMRLAGWERSVGIAGAVAIVGVLAIAVADVTAGVSVALISGAIFIAVAQDAPSHSIGYAVALVAVWVAAALGAGTVAVRLRAQAQRGVAEAVSLHRELVGLLVPSPRLRRVDVSVAAVCRPGEQRLELGGDFYAATERADGSVALLVGDVSGHGPAAAALAAMLRAAWEGLVEADVPPGCACALSTICSWSTRASRNSSRPCSVVINPDLTEARITLAGHPPPIVAAAGAMIDLDLPAGAPLGVSDLANWSPRHVALPEASLLLYTDGVIEGRVTAIPGERFGEARLIEAFVQSPLQGRELLNDILLAAGSAHGGPLPDDAALLFVAQANAQSTHGAIPAHRETHADIRMRTSPWRIPCARCIAAFKWVGERRGSRLRCAGLNF